MKPNASLTHRAIASGLDLLLVFTGSGLLYALLKAIAWPIAKFQGPIGAVLALCIYLSFVYLYGRWSWSEDGQTIGMKFFGMKKADKNGELLSKKMFLTHELLAKLLFPISLIITKALGIRSIKTS